MRSSKQPAKLAMLLPLALLLLCCGIDDVHCSSIHENRVDLHSLFHFKQGITNDPYGALSNWSNNTHFCRWNSVICTTTRPLRVLSLNLTGQSLAGQITPSLGNLTFLYLLDLSDNHFAGTLPLLNHLQHLEVLFLRNNLLRGTFTDELTNCSKLSYLDLSRNMLTGVVPPHIDNLTNLIGLSLARNNLTGIIPPALGAITNLTQVDLSGNQLSGQIPNEIWQMPSITKLALDDNNLSGGIPQSLPNISSLQMLSMPDNTLGGTLPSNIGDALPSLQYLYLGINMFEGHIPASLGNASMLQEIDLPANNLNGQIPSSLGNLSELTFLNLEGNKLEANDSEGWEFFHALTNCRHLEAITISDNQLQGDIRNSIGNLSVNLQYLLMGGNNLSGIVPPTIGKLQNLIQLSLDYNNLTGTLEAWVGKLIKLQHLNLQKNNFVGTISPSISNLSQLIFFSLAENGFTGSIPPSLGNLQHTLTFNLSHNNLKGTIPIEFGNLKTLIELDLSANNLSGEIPETLGQCFGLVNMQMKQNFLTGNIPITFGNLLMLNMLNISHNYLSGPIPQALNELGLLTMLDLSFNHLQGDIPRNGVFENATAVSLEGNWGLCGGVKDLYMPLCPTISRRSKTEYYLVRALVPIFGITSLLVLIYTTILWKKTSPRTYKLLLSFGKKFPIVSYKDLDRATESFSDSTLIGRGRYGSVYIGELMQAKIQVAIKVFDLDMKCADKSFLTECEVLRNIRHRNLLPILTACSTIDNHGDDFKALIYEYMPNGNLDSWLHNRFSDGSSKCLSLVQRVSIAVDIANALTYLHHDCARVIVHCDLKPTNILLDNDMNAYLGDFGIASLLGHSDSNSSTTLKGTIGYIAPEYAQIGQASSRGDVYSFGIVLLEMLIGKRPADPMFENDLNIVNFVRRNYPDQILYIIDAHLHGEFKDCIQASIGTEDAAYGCSLSLMQVALSCTCLITRERLNMREVATKLHAIKTSYIGATRREQVMLQ